MVRRDFDKYSVSGGVKSILEIIIQKFWVGYKKVKHHTG